MTDPLPTTSYTVAAASSGDLVCGLATVSPPAPFTGQIGDPADDVAQSMVNGVLRAAGVTLPTPPRVTINGRLVGTTGEVATALPAASAPGVAHMPQGCGFARIGGCSLTLMRAPALVTPTSAIGNLGGAQSFVRLISPPAPEEPTGLTESSVDQARQDVPPRSSFAEPGPMAQMLSSVSMGRHQDLAPAEYEVLVGDPVNVVTGSVVTLATDFERAVPSLRFQRRYDSRRSDRATSLGYGWCHELDQQITLEPGRVVLRDGDGREKEFDTSLKAGRVCRPGDTLADATGRYRLRCVAPHTWELSDGVSTRHFAAVAGDSPQARDRGTARLVRLARAGEGSVTECVYDDGALVEARVDGVTVLRFEYSERGLLRRIYSSGAAGQMLHAKFEYSAEGDLLRASDPTGRAREYEYVDHLLVRETNRDGGSFYYAYDAVGPRARCTRTWGDGGYLSRSLEHDPSGGVTVVSDSYGQHTTYRYNPAGLVTRIEGPGGEGRQLRYDRQLRLTTVQWSDGTTERAKYDRLGHLTERTERDGATYHMKYDAEGRMVEATDAQGGRWAYEYDHHGRLRRVEDPSGHATRFDFDSRGGMCRVTEATGNQMFIRINDQGQIVEMPRRGEGRVAYSYDASGRLGGARDSEDRQSRWHYDAMGRLTQRDGAAAACSWEYTPEGRLVEYVHGRHRAGVERDAFGMVRGIDTPSHQIRYALDTEGRLMRASQGQADVLKIERSEAGQVEAWETPEDGRCELRRRLGGSAIVGLRWPEQTVTIEWDDAGRIEGFKDGAGNESRFAYRADGLLTEARNDHIVCSFDREPRGAIRLQRWGPVIMQDLNPDHRGRRLGMRLGANLRVSYLRRSNGSVEDVAVVTDAGVEAGAELRRRSRERAAARSPSATEPETNFDALWRPMSPDGVRAQVWDEERCVVLDGEARIHHPDEDRVMFVVAEDGSVRPVDDDATRGEPAPTMIDRVHATAFPALDAPAENAPDALPTPSQLLGEVLGYRAWNPAVRPIPGRAPWNPDAWEARVDPPQIDVGRLDSKALLRALGSPHPRAALAI